MNREEYYHQRRIFRAAISSIDRGHLKMSEEEAKEVWNLFWQGIYQSMPDVIYRSIIDRRDRTGAVWDLTSNGMKCNIYCAPNSWPHKTRNP